MDSRILGKLADEAVEYENSNLVFRVPDACSTYFSANQINQLLLTTNFGLNLSIALVTPYISELSNNDKVNQPFKLLGTKSTNTSPFQNHFPAHSLAAN